MKTKSINRMWRELLTQLDADSSLGALLNAQTWLRKNLSAFGTLVIEGHRGHHASQYKLERFVELDLKQFPLGESGVDLQAEILALHQGSAPVTSEGLAAIVRDLFWNAITVGSGKSCPNCERQEELKILVSAVDPEAAYLACDNCSWVETIQGMNVSSIELSMMAPTTNQLERARRQLLSCSR